MTDKTHLIPEFHRLYGQSITNTLFKYGNTTQEHKIYCNYRSRCELGELVSRRRKASLAKKIIVFSIVPI